MSIGPHEGANPLTLPTSSGPVVGSHSGAYLGFTVRETSGTTAAHITLYDNASAASGAILEEISLTGGGEQNANYPPPGRYVGNGIYAAITGAVEGSVFQ
jgi:hypothetical protein